MTRSPTTRAGWWNSPTASSRDAAGSWDRRETLTDSTRIDFVLVDDADLTIDAERDETLLAITEVRSRDQRRDNYTAIVGTRFRIRPRLNAVIDDVIAGSPITRPRSPALRPNSPSRTAS